MLYAARLSFALTFVCLKLLFVAGRGLAGPGPQHPVGGGAVDRLALLLHRALQLEGRCGQRAHPQHRLQV